ncbi:Clavaminate synthase-like protein [Macrolepiota fuliginosa MF-IS2]|uniref:Clavaminate synthase-like protein n=1 Tax=Macrolepiota fuliginosa MF-IS2 TaxID=1400762 RepID=A0A9P5X720_9AGAR|nr:Clavaminate synthase-like protein [Macrolepiota fuliginosa MF-IS2]
MALPFEEKIKFDQGSDGTSAGYKAAGSNAVDANGEKDTVEFLNIAKDDVQAWPSHVHRTYPAPIERGMPTIIQPFVQKSLEVNQTILDIFNERLGLPKGLLLQQHPLDEHSGCEARIIKNPPMAHDVQKRAIGAHTDFGSLSFLHNRLGGLQVLVPGAETWQYVKPIPNHAICNVGDALSIFSGGILRSNMHRVLPPPGTQSAYERWSIVFFTRPGNSKVLRAFTESSSAIAKAVSANPGKDFETGSTAKEWFARRIKYQKLDNRKGPETWMSSRGTEADPAAA